MKTNILFILLTLFLVSCQEQLPSKYHGNNMIQFSSKDDINYYWSAALDPDSEYDTCWIEVKSVGRIENYDRKFELVQVNAIDYDLVYDKVGNVVDTNYFDVPNQAVVEKHYIAFDNEGLQRFMVLPAGEYKVDIPIVMHKDIDNTKVLTLKVEMKTKDENTLLGDPRYLIRTIKVH